SVKVEGYERLKAEFDLTAHIPAQTIALPEDIYIVAGTTREVSVILTPDNATEKPSLTIGDTAYAMLDARTLKANAIGETTLTGVISNGASATCKVYICYPVTSVAFERESVVIAVGESAQLHAKVTMQGQNCENQLVTFKSSDESIASVSKDGVVTGVANGKVAITAKSDEGIEASCEVIVRLADIPDLDGDGTSTGDDAIIIL
ncbi:MAG: Ig-like domain-containing protein, partial [Clostridia bacterium]|nr:Ig-like domain-containing protein [Clostridia bacterium]